MDSEIKVMVNERLDKIEYNFVQTNKECHMTSIKLGNIQIKLRNIVSDEIKELVDELIEAQSDMNILLKEEIYKKAFKDGLMFREYL